MLLLVLSTACVSGAQVTFNPTNMSSAVDAWISFSGSTLVRNLEHFLGIFSGILPFNGFFNSVGFFAA